MYQQKWNKINIPTLNKDSQFNTLYNNKKMKENLIPLTYSHDVGIHKIK